MAINRFCGKKMQIHLEIFGKTIFLFYVFIGSKVVVPKGAAIFFVPHPAQMWLIIIILYNLNEFRFFLEKKFAKSFIQHYICITFS